MIINMIIVSNYFTQAGQEISSKKAIYFDYFITLNQKLKSIPQKDKKVVLDLVEQEFQELNDFDKLDNSYIEQIIRGAMIQQIENKTHAIVQDTFNTIEQFDNTIACIIDNKIQELAQIKHINESTLSPLFDCNEIKNLIQTQECCICFENDRLRTIPCYNTKKGKGHSDQICPGCLNKMKNCPICAAKIILPRQPIISLLLDLMEYLNYE